MNADAIPSFDAVGLAEFIREGHIEPSEVLELCLARIGRLDPHVNAVVSLYADRARARVGTLDRALPFAGVPLLIKETTAYAGERTTFGSAWLEDYASDTTDPVISALESLGFVVVGMTNAPEFGLTDVTEPVIFGPSRNPWNLSHSPGGSSGGSAAAVAAGFVPFAHGSDGGGSLRAPASHCGMVSLKPSRGWPSPPLTLPGAEWLPGLVSRFGISRSVRDLKAILLALDPFFGVDRIAPRPAKALKIACVRPTLLGQRPHPDVETGLQAAIETFSSLGHDVEPIDWPFDAPRFHTAFFDAWAALADGYINILSGMTGRARNDARLEPWTRELVARARKLDVAAAGRASDALSDAAAAYDSLMDRYDVLLTPVYAKLPPLVGEHSTTADFAEIFPKVAEGVSYTPLQNATGAPAVSLPAGRYTNDGGSYEAGSLPVGVQISGRIGDELLLLDLAAQYEDARPWPLLATLD
ncbi:MAG: amidase family protein [Pseudomonadota bacterium]